MCTCLWLDALVCVPCNISQYTFEREYGYTVVGPSGCFTEVNCFCALAEESIQLCLQMCVFGMANRHAQDEQEQYSSNQGFEGSFLFVFRITILSVMLGMRQITTRKNAWVFISVSIAE